jgi:ubiquinone/menaquinone biosynthesis C-methylase UbiE
MLFLYSRFGLEQTLSSKFNARSADAYERLMGRWSRVLARPFLEFAGLRAGERILDAGCGTGSLMFTIPQVADVASIEGIDFSEVYVEAARHRNTDPRITISQGDICALPFRDGTFDRSLALLVLHFVPESQQAVAEMRRVVKPGGVVAATVWDSYGGMPWMRMFWDTAVALFPSATPARTENLFKPMSRPGEMQAVFTQAGLAEVTDTALMIRMQYEKFEDLWAPHAAGEGQQGKYLMTLDSREREVFERAMRDAYEAGQPDGPRSFAAVAWACRGVVP